MKAPITLIAISAVALVAVGCTSKKTAKTSALDINDPATPVYTAPKPVTAQQQPVAQPVVYDSQPAPAYPQQNGQFAAGQPAAQATAMGGNYQVKRGDTLFSIAKTRYGNGNQWQRIASANPGLTPQNLKAGQTIALP